MAGAALDGISRPRLLVQLVLCIFLLSVARRPALENWVRPIEGPRSVLHKARDEQYFSDMVQWGNGPTYQQAVQLLTGQDCRVIGIDSTNLSLEYPLMALLRQANPQTVFLHTKVQNASARYRPPVTGTPCAIVCLDCAGDDTRQSLYDAYPVKTIIDNFVVFQGKTF
jgi:hypothetical protein